MTIAGVFDRAALAPAPVRRGAVERAWAALVGTGPTLVPHERHDVIRAARSAWRGETNDGLDVLGEAAHAIAVDAEGITAELVDELERRGLDRLRYLEVVGIVGRLSNVDWYLWALGTEPPDLPTPTDAPATGRIHTSARLTDSWVPMLGAASAPLVLDALIDEGESLRDLHEAMYIDLHRIADWTHGGVLSRVQIEYLAARTSYLNECFY